MSCGLLGYNTPADHKMEILRALVKFVNQILRTYRCKKKQKKNWSSHGGFVCRFAHKNKSECPVIIWTRQNLFKAAFPLKLCTRMLFCNKKWVTQGRRHAFWEPFGTGRPFSVHKRMSCSLAVCFGSCQPLPSIFIFLFILPFIIHTPFQTFQILLCSLLHRILCRQLICREQTRVGMLSQLVFDSEDAPEFCRRSTFC